MLGSLPMMENIDLSVPMRPGRVTTSTATMAKPTARTLYRVRQFHAASVFGIILGLAVSQLHVTFDREQIGEQPASEHDDQSSVGQMNSEFAPAPFEPFHVRGNQVNQQDRTDQMATRKNGDFESGGFGRPPYKQTLKIALLRFMNPEMNLGQRPGEDQNHSSRQTDDRQLQRGNQINESAHE